MIRRWPGASAWRTNRVVGGGARRGCESEFCDIAHAVCVSMAVQRRSRMTGGAGNSEENRDDLQALAQMEWEIRVSIESHQRHEILGVKPRSVLDARHSADQP